MGSSCGHACTESLLGRASQAALSTLQSALTVGGQVATTECQHGQSKCNNTHILDSILSSTCVVQLMIWFHCHRLSTRWPHSSVSLLHCLVWGDDGQYKGLWAEGLPSSGQQRLSPRARASISCAAGRDKCSLLGLCVVVSHASLARSLAQAMSPRGSTVLRVSPAGGQVRAHQWRPMAHCGLCTQQA